MTLDGEFRERKIALNRGVQQALETYLPVEHKENFRGFFSRHVNAFRRALRGDLPSKVEAMKIKVKPGVQTVKAGTRRHYPTRSKWLARCIATLTVLVS